jgi:hypothetical protein
MVLKVFDALVDITDITLSDICHFSILYGHLGERNMEVSSMPQLNHTRMDLISHSVSLRHQTSRVGLIACLQSLPIFRTHFSGYTEYITIVSCLRTCGNLVKDDFRQPCGQGRLEWFGLP